MLDAQVEEGCCDHKKAEQNKAQCLEYEEEVREFVQFGAAEMRMEM